MTIVISCLLVKIFLTKTPIQTNLFSSFSRLAFLVLLQPCPDTRVINLSVTVSGVNDRLLDLRQAGEGQVKVKVNTLLFDVISDVIVVEHVRGRAVARLFDNLTNINHLLI